MVIGIIGGGASGMAAALAAAENENVQVILMERQSRVGRKLSATGNGRCNLTNLHALEGGYHGEDAAFSQYALNAFCPEKRIYDSITDFIPETFYESASGRRCL